MSCTAYIGLGSNIEKPISQLLSALDALDSHPRISLKAVSSFYRNPPMGPQDQPDFVNAVVEIETDLEPEALLDTLIGIEDAHGRERNGKRWGPRTLDLDLLAYGEEIIETERLTVPHPGIPTRSFVLKPMAEIAPHLVLPGMGSVQHLLEDCDTYWMDAIRDEPELR
ncbi:MAG: 2-amino-4-hydroxy-6-hydroxymethyldihydropteridine diphosphokinase [Gammaproteobacteria bacterium]|nr:2-amino-4-hydroxy-6-hydroxymethyldihydropteridine diphosphokinase [Gammaproteobacteria bacterium]MBU1655021.1 2-amino-4-hydroxy-6-hydroxymethyldihydropteridine diphosphokinase [Gammaproteobacteria bacterium]MBU1960327.1 2-amino-4-hydroxy-6-hydroxymethyldihydropteridine diphosphokinase [Gammaproteobacteria bacterium]